MTEIRKKQPEKIRPGVAGVLDRWRRNQLGKQAEGPKTKEKKEVVTSIH